jgi:hypothetical protein
MKTKFTEKYKSTRKKPAAKKSGFQARLEEMAKQAQERQKQQQANKKK